MSFSRFILVRHGETAGNRGGLFYGKTDLPLTDRGHCQAAEVASYLKEASIDSIIISELKRAKQTAEHIRSPQLHRYHSDPRLNEMDFGDWEMQHYSEIAARYPEEWDTWINNGLHASPTHGESFEHFATRVQAVADTLRQQDTTNTQLIVAHKGVLGLITAHWLGLPVEAMWQFPYQHGSYSVVECCDGYMTLSVFNGRSPYPPVLS